ncbi:hypothetical protein PGT21_027281 [Puccinia graminis f. sp. tritici]|uniref:CCHC-type domain-containing protein n=1 Tax=Puccinia graminis f. sp. tritici TaxID=56615 RepID=A0A5B0LZP8_PUCGR|nr:hypothetical protein PGT21_027281 [Puccinia graminis f. sp. tritici]KAA1130968.1 hypothetical protein PGTUg99_017827 [Puccinia graminis f. sp. tritici]
MATSSTPASRSQPNTPPPGTPSASRPPSRHSTRITTPVRNDPNFVRPSNDSRKALPPSSATQTSARQTRKRPQRPLSASASTLTRAARKTKKAKASQTHKKHKSKRVFVSSGDSESESDSESSSQSEPETHGTAKMIDFTQDSDDANRRFKLHKTKAQPKESEFDKIEEYFHPPVFEEGNFLIVKSHNCRLVDHVKSYSSQLVINRIVPSGISDYSKNVRLPSSTECILLDLHCRIVGWNCIGLPRWRSRLEDVLGMQNTLDIVKGTLPCPKEDSKDVNTSSSRPVDSKGYNPKEIKEDWDALSEMACSTIRLTLTDPLAQQYRKVKPASRLFSTIVNAYEKNTRALAADELLSIGELPTDRQITDRLVGGLDSSWSAVWDSIMYTAIKMSLDDTIGALEAHEVSLNGNTQHDLVSAASAKHLACSNCGKRGHRLSDCRKKNHVKTKASAATTVKLGGYDSGSFDDDDEIGVIYE